jgi:hypothetical protein
MEPFKATSNDYTVDQQIISDIMDKLDVKIVEEFIKDYCVSEYEARKSLAEMLYVNDYVR